ncbi:MAG: HipA family kinase [Opitutaceae bacterium]
MIPPTEQEFGTVEAVELKRLTNRGAMKPLLCRANDGAHYILKPFSTGRSWPLVLEWICARLGRALGIPIPNYRRVVISEELAGEWNALNKRQIESGVGFGSQLVASAMEFEVSLIDNIPEDLRLRVLAFDWWIRNQDRGENNPNLLWSAETRALHVIDHDQAGHPENASIFWGTHLFKALAPAGSTWLPSALAAEFTTAASRLLPSPVVGELPPTWTSDPDGVNWFIRQLHQSPNNASHREWENHD